MDQEENDSTISYSPTLENQKAEVLFLVEKVQRTEENKEQKTQNEKKLNVEKTVKKILRSFRKNLKDKFIEKYGK